MASFTSTFATPVVAVPALKENGENFTSWKDAIIDHLTSQKLARYIHFDHTIDESTKPPFPSSTDPKIRAEEQATHDKWWEVYDTISSNIAKVKIFIANTLPDSVRTEFTSRDHNGNIAAAWKALSSRFQQNNPLTVARLVKQLYRTDCHDMSSLGQHLNNLAEQRARLHSCGRTFTDEEFGCIIITSLPESMSSWLSLYASGKTHLLASELITALRDHFIQFFTSPTPATQPVALVTSPPSSAVAPAATTTALVADNSRSKYRRLKCTNCKRQGHTIENCWAKGGGREGQGPEGNKFGYGDSPSVVNDQDKPGDDKPRKAFAAFVGTTLVGGGTSIHGDREDALLLTDE